MAGHLRDIFGQNQDLPSSVLPKTLHFAELRARFERQMAAYTEDVGRRIRRARESNRPDLSQEAAAHEVGVSVKQYGRWERGESSPRADKWERLAEVLGVPVVEIRGELPAVAEHELRIQLGRLEVKLDALLVHAGINPASFDVPADGAADIEDAATEATELLGGSAGATREAKPAPARRRRAS